MNNWIEEIRSDHCYGAIKGCLLSSVVFLILYAVTGMDIMSSLAAFAGAVIGGMGRELFDRQFDWTDVLAVCAGAVQPVALIAGYKLVTLVLKFLEG